mmetsp:Transcript_16820/g.38730  ORF Transcript_16820/g.38730 Transcript_16820/m.38730 type:complete len:247 (-) Transcript_16820:348-1088(-)
MMTIHVAKVFGIDFMGFAHEYTPGCFEPFVSKDETTSSGGNWFSDGRVWILLFFLYSILSSTIDMVFDRRKSLEPAFLWIFFLSWMSSTWLPCIFGGHFDDAHLFSSTAMAAWILGGHWMANALHYAKYASIRIVLLLAMAWATVVWSKQIMMRTTHWMDPSQLLQQTQSTCPKSAKALMELGQVYSKRSTPKMYHHAGYSDPDEMYNLTKALYVIVFFPSIVVVVVVVVSLMSCVTCLSVSISGN